MKLLILATVILGLGQAKAQDYYFTSTKSLWNSTQLTPSPNSIDQALLSLLVFSGNPFGVTTHASVAGPDGPLGSIGPYGSSSWQPTLYIDFLLKSFNQIQSLTGVSTHFEDKSDCKPTQFIIGFLSFTLDWPNWAETCEGVMGPDGPLGENGPIGELYYKNNDYQQGTLAQYHLGGVLGLYGAGGPFGPLGLMGPLGPNGGHLLNRQIGGSYHDSGGSTQRTTVVNYSQNKTRVYELFELYTENYAFSMDDNDTSFAVDGSIERTPVWGAVQHNEVDSYRFQSNESQFVTLLLVPSTDRPFSSFFWLPDVTGLLSPRFRKFNIELWQVKGREMQLLYESQNDLTGFAHLDFVQIKVKAGSEFQVNVSTPFHPHFDLGIPALGNALLSDYRIIVTGSSKYLQTTPVQGDHQVSYEPL